MYAAETPDKWIKFVSASGGIIGHYGPKKTMSNTGENYDNLMSLGFDVLDMKKPLTAVWRIPKKGNIVWFGLALRLPLHPGQVVPLHPGQVVQSIHIGFI